MLKFFKRKGVDIYCRYGKCPICDGKIEFEETDYIDTYFCVNGCYSYHPWYPINGDSFRKFNIFSESELLEHGEFITNFFLRRKLIKKINHWKQDERYLMKIIENNL
ncbi:MAG: hypothetical protein K0R18_528 [Bacillales bacterium]|jgi:hypothetical protein|nr:hypothetical protein [Bacillales bacterium]